MIGFSLLSLVISFFIFILVREVIFALGPTNLMYANLLVILVGTLIVSFVFTYRQFRYLGREKWRSPIFHSVLLRTFVINFIIIFLISLVM